MWNRKKKIPVIVLLGVLLTSCFEGSPGKKDRSPLDELPAHIKQITHFGERADWSYNGKRILFLAKTFGDVYEVEIETKIIRPAQSRQNKKSTQWHSYRKYTPAAVRTSVII